MKDFIKDSANVIKGLNINRIQNGRFMVVTTTVASWVVFHVGIELSHGFIKMIDIYRVFHGFEIHKDERYSYRQLCKEIKRIT